MAHDSSSVLPILLLGGAAFLAWQYFSSQTLVASTAVSTTGTPTVPVGTSPTAPNITTLPLQVTQQVTQPPTMRASYYTPTLSPITHGGGALPIARVGTPLAEYM
jgi:hypothetical protein